MTTSYLAYVRVSSTKQLTGVSLAEQRLAIETYARDRHLRIAHWYEDIQTAATRGRSQFGALLKELRASRSRGLIIHKIDRGARNLRDWADLGELIDRGVDVRFAHDNLDLETRGGRLTADIQAVIAADFIRNLREETRKGFYGRLRQGLYPLAAPVGYVDRGRGRAKTPDPIKAPLIVRAFELYAAGDLTLKELAADLAVRGLVTRGNSALSASALSRILRRPFYAGWFVVRGERFHGIHQPLISPQLFGRVQSALRRRRHPHARIHHFRYARQLRCACKRALIGERQKAYVYYRCHHCPRVSLREDRIEHQLSARECISSLTTARGVRVRISAPQERAVTPFEKFDSP